MIRRVYGYNGQKPQPICMIRPKSQILFPLGVLGKGESSVISLAETLAIATPVLHDLAARRCAMALRLPVTGTLGLLLMAKKAGCLEKVAPALDAVVDAGLFIPDRHIQAIRDKAGES
jgi:predicted nucleic acid-binding protein